jgi:tetratricopeptide (TPR) repeat protein
VVRDPKFALAYVALSGNYGMMAVDGLERPTDAWPQVSRYMRQALALDPSLPEAAVMEHARVFLFDWDWAAAEAARKKFLASPVGDFDPQFSRALAVELWAMGRTKEALQLARRTRELDTRSPYLAVLEADYLLRDDQFDAAIALYEYAIRLDPENSNALFGLAETLMRQKRFDEAIEARRKAHMTAGDDRLAPLFATAKGEAGIARSTRPGCGCSSMNSRSGSGPNMSHHSTSHERTRSLATRNRRSSISTPPSSIARRDSCF